MNRQERREYERKYGQAFTMQKYREDAFNSGFKEGVNTTYCVVMNMVAYTINYKLDFGEKRLQRIIQQIADNIDSYRTGQLNANDYNEIKEIVRGLGIKIDIK